MKADKRKIEWLLYESGVTMYQISKNTEIDQATLSRINSGKTDIEKLPFYVASKLTNYAKKIKGEFEMYKLTVKEEGKLQTKETFNSFEELKNHLTETDYFDWINDNEPDVELPDFSDVETLREIKAILREYDYGWWTVEVLYDEQEKANF